MKSLLTISGNWRWIICALLFFATTINYMDRQILGLLAPVLEKEMGWSEVEYSNLVTAFQIAYAIGLVAFGWLIDFSGTKRGYALAMVVWSLAAMGHALARTVGGFGVARFALGLGEAGNFPAAIKSVAEWFPKKERALATGIFNCGANVGAIMAPIVVPWLTIKYGWQESFIVVGALGFIWLIFWLPIYGAPESSSKVSPAELAHIRSDPPEIESSQKISWKRLLSYRQTWAYIAGTALTSPVWWFYLYWLPKFFSKQFSLDLMQLGAPLLVIYTMTTIGSIGGGWISSHLLARGWSINGARKTALLICAACALPAAIALASHNVWLVSVIIGLAAAGHQGWSANLYTLVSDLFPKRVVASVVGLGAMFGSVAAIAFAQATGFVLQATGHYWLLFAVCGCAYLVAFIIIHLLIPRMHPVEAT